MSISRSALVPLIPLVLALAPACDTPVEEDLLAGANDQKIRIELFNFDTDNVHLFSRTEDFPCCRVSPNQGRAVVIFAKEGEVVEFRAGRQGSIIDTVRCTVRLANLPTRTGPNEEGYGSLEFLVTQDLRCTGVWASS